MKEGAVRDAYPLVGLMLSVYLLDLSCYFYLGVKDI